MTTPSTDRMHERMQRALDVIARLLPNGRPGRPGGAVPAEIERDYRRFTTGAAFGDVWSRPGLDLRSRSMITVASLTAMHLPNELRTHIHIALNLGITREEIGEIIMHMAIYAGMPRAGEAMRVAAEVFAERDASA